MADPNLATAVAPTAATTAVATVPAAVVTPKRGGFQPTYGKFIGGAKLTDQYMLVPLTSGSYFRFFTQRRHENNFYFKNSRRVLFPVPCAGNRIRSNTSLYVDSTCERQEHIPLSAIPLFDTCHQPPY
jgi:hypothetical protein